MRHPNSRTSSRRPTTPSNPSTTSTPLSTPSSHGAVSPPPPSPASPEHSDDELSGSFLVVGEDDEESSTIGSSLRDSVSDLLSDTSDEQEHVGPEGWEGSSDGHEGRNEHDRESDLLLVESSFLEGSYTDAEARTIPLTGSMDTIQQAFNSMSSSQIRLILPDPAASFTTPADTISDGNTPSDSIANLISFQDGTGYLPVLSDLAHGRRVSSPAGGGVDPSWLASSKLWHPPPEIQSLLKENGEGEYELLASRDSMVPIQDINETGEKAGRIMEAAAKQQPSQPSSAEAASGRLTKDRDDRLAVKYGNLRNLAKQWSLPVSAVLTLGIMGLALLGAVGPGTSSVLPSGVEQDTSARSAYESSSFSFLGRALSLWDHSSVPLITAPGASSIPSPALTSSQVIPDLKLIRQAISTLSTRPQEAALPSELLTTKQSVESAPIDTSDEATTARRKRRLAMVSTTCCSLSVRPNAEVALTVPSSSKVGLPTNDSWPRTVHQRFRQSNISQPEAAQEFSHPSPCECPGLRTPQLGILASMSDSIDSAKRGLGVALRYTDHVFGPAIMELRREVNEVLALAHSLAETASTLSQFLIRRSGRGINVTRIALDKLTARLARSMPISLPLPFKSKTRPIEDLQAGEVAREALALARVSIDALSEYVESRASGLQNKGLASLKQARRGLDRIITEAKKVASPDEPPDGSTTATDVPKLFARMGGLRERPNHRLGQRTRRRPSERSLGGIRGVIDRAKAAFSPNPLPPPPEKPSMGRKILDLVHHGAIALVL